MSEFNSRIPRYLDASPKVFIWDADQFVAAMAPFGVGIVTGYLFSSILFGVLLAWGLGKIKKGRGSGFLLRAAYWNLPAVKLKRTPPSHIREFAG